MGKLPTSSLFIAGDWGTSNLRLALCRGDEVLARVNGAGIEIAIEPPEPLFLQLTAPWTAEHGPLPTLLCGAVGSRSGWIQTPYVPCPANAVDFQARLLRFETAGHAVAIVPGLSCLNPLGAPDVMRGEETQILGALTLQPALARGRRLFVLPGTHTKWVVVEDGRVASFLTAPIGELFALLSNGSTLAVSPNDEITLSAEGFAFGLARQARHGAIGLPQLLFETRSRQLLEGMSPSDAMSFLSGLLIGSDVAGARGWFGAAEDVILIGNTTLTTLYAQALQLHGTRSETLDGGHCSLAGLRTLFIDGSQSRHAA